MQCQKLANLKRNNLTKESEMENDSNFALPESFKEADWAKDIKSVDDLCEKVDNQHKALSKRALPGENAPDDIWEQHIGKMKDVATKQDWADLVGEDNEIKDLFVNVGVAKKQAKPILDFIKSKEVKKYSPDEFNKLAAERLGKEKLDKATGVLGKLSEEKRNALLESTNEQLLQALDVFADVADVMAVPKSNIPLNPTNTGGSNQKVMNADGSLNKENYDKYLEEVESIPKSPERDSKVEAIRKKWGL